MLVDELRRSCGISAVFLWLAIDDQLLPNYAQSCVDLKNVPYERVSQKRHTSQEENRGEGAWSTKIQEIIDIKNECKLRS